MINSEQINKVIKAAVLTYIQVSLAEVNNNLDYELNFSTLWLDVYNDLMKYLRKEGNIQQISPTHIGRDPNELMKVGNFLTEKVMTLFVPFDKESSVEVLLTCKNDFVANQINWSDEVISEINDIIKDCQIGKIKRYPNLICTSCGEETDIRDNDTVIINNQTDIEKVLENSAYLFKDTVGNYICEDCIEDKYNLPLGIKRDFLLIYKDHDHEWERILTKIKELKKTKSVEDILTLLN